MAPFLGWTAVFFTLAGMSVVSLILLSFFTETRSLYIPYDAEERITFKRRREGKNDDDFFREKEDKFYSEDE